MAIIGLCLSLAFSQPDRKITAKTIFLWNLFCHMWSAVIDAKGAVIDAKGAVMTALRPKGAVVTALRVL
jgi:hypothetical protein